MKNESRENIVQAISNMPSALDAEDVSDFCSLAQYYALKTPVSFRNDLMQVSLKIVYKTVFTLFSVSIIHKTKVTKWSQTP